MLCRSWRKWIMTIYYWGISSVNQDTIFRVTKFSWVQDRAFTYIWCSVLKVFGTKMLNVVIHGTALIRSQVMSKSACFFIIDMTMIRLWTKKATRIDRGRAKLYYKKTVIDAEKPTLGMCSIKYVCKPCCFSNCIIRSDPCRFKRITLRNVVRCSNHVPWQNYWSLWHQRRRPKKNYKVEHQVVWPGGG